MEQVGSRTAVGGFFPGFLSAHTHMIARCACGHVSFPRIDAWQKSRACRSCAATGRAHPLRKPGQGFRRLLLNYVGAARQRGLAFELTEEAFRELTASPCRYCGALPAQVAGADGHDPYTYNGVDRIDSSKGYTADNCVPCCFPCNRIKGSLPVDVFLERVRAIARRHGWTS